MIEIPQSIEDVIDFLLPSLKNPNVSRRSFSDTECATIREDDLILLISFRNHYNLISIDNKSCYNKESQCPIHVSLPLSNRKLKRLEQAMKLLRTKEGERASATFDWKRYGYDEFDDGVRSEFYWNS